MIDEHTKQAKIEQFLNDKLMSQCVKDILLETFLKAKPDADVHEKAARFIAVENLNVAWSVMARLRDIKRGEEAISVQVGL